MRMDRADRLTDRIRGWFERTPKAQQAVRRLSADLDTVVERVDSATSGLQKAVAPWIDPPRTQTPEQAESAQEIAEGSAEPGSRAVIEAPASEAAVSDAPPSDSAPEGRTPEGRTPEGSHGA
jgi:hypothetical protein